MVADSMNTAQVCPWAATWGEAVSLNEPWPGRVIARPDNHRRQSQEFVIEASGRDERAIQARTTLTQQCLHSPLCGEKFERSRYVNVGIPGDEDLCPRKTQSLNSGAGELSGDDKNVEIGSVKDRSIGGDLTRRCHEDLEWWRTPSIGIALLLEQHLVVWRNELGGPEVISLRAQSIGPHHHRISSGAKQTHQPLVMRVEVADITATLVAGNGV